MEAIEESRVGLRLTISKQTQQPGVFGPHAMVRRDRLGRAEFTTERYSRSVTLGAVPGAWPGPLPGTSRAGAPGPQAEKDVS